MGKIAKNKRKLTVVMERELIAEIEAQAEREDRSRNEMINQLVRVFLSRGAVHLDGKKGGGQ